MEMSGFSSGIYHACLWICRLAYVNLLWMLFTLSGLVIFGFMPATVALFSITRKWIMGEKGIPVFSFFWQTYKKEFLKSNVLGINLFVIGFILFLDLTYLPTTGLFFTGLRVGLLVCTFLFIVILLYIFPMYVHYEWKNRRYIKNALLLGAAYPHFTMTMFVGVVFLYIILANIPSIIPFFSVSILAFISMGVSFQVFKKANLVPKSLTEKAG